MKTRKAAIAKAVKSSSEVFGWDKKRSISEEAHALRSLIQLSGTPETQEQLVALWLSSDPNTAKLILSAFRIGVEEGKRAERCGEPDTVLGVLGAFKQIMEALPDKDAT